MYFSNNSVCFLTMNEFCSVELLGYKFTVPCNVEDTLSANYGDKKNGVFL